MGRRAIPNYGRERHFGNFIMKITTHLKPFHYLVVEDLWTREERARMFEEVLLLEKNGIFRPPIDTGSSEDKDGVLQKDNSAIFFDDIFNSREHSIVLKLNRKVFDIFPLEEIQLSWFFKDNVITRDTTLISYYENADYYKKHNDSADITIVSYFFKEPKRFLGGTISFPEYNIEFEVTNTLTIIFPSNIMHEVSEIKLNEKDRGLQYGRFCMSQFLNH
jgi:hypothetical protein